MKQGSFWKRIAATLLGIVVVFVQSGFAALAEPVPGAEVPGTDGGVSGAVYGESVADAVYGTVGDAVYGGGAFLSLFSTDEGLPEVHGFGKSAYGILGNGDDGGRYLAPALATKLADLHVVDIATGLEHSVVLTKDGAVYAFGRNNYGQLGNGSNTNSLDPVAVDLSGVDGKVVSISAGDYHTLLLTDEGKAYAFGDNRYGQLGLNSSETRFNVPTLIPLEETVASIEANYYTSFLVTTEGEAYSFGWNQYGKLGLGMEYYDMDVFEPKRIAGFAPGAKVKSISTGSSHTLAVMEDGRLYAMGSVPGIGGPWLVEPAPIAELADEFIVSASAGVTAFLALTADGRVFASGQTMYGQLGLDPKTIEGGSVAPTELPASLFGGEKVVAVASANNYGLVLTETRRVYSFGKDEYTGQGIDTDEEVALPKEITPAGVQIMKIAAKRQHSLLLTRGPSVFDVPDPPSNVTVEPGHRQLTVSFTPPVYDGGTPVTSYTVFVFNDSSWFWKTGTNSPITVDGLTNAVEYQVMVQSTNARGTSKTSAPPVAAMPAYPAVAGLGLFAFGDNGQGQLGLGDQDARVIPELVPGLPSPIAFAAGEEHSLVAGADGKLYAFGDGIEGKLGLGDMTDRTSPTPLSAFVSEAPSMITAVSGGDKHSLVVTASGALYGFGFNYYGQIGDFGIGGSLLEPVRILEDVKFVDVAAGSGFSLALSEEGDVYTLGLGQNSAPKRIEGGWPADERAIAIAAGSSHALVLTDRGRVYSFGAGVLGRLGHGDEENQTAPKRIEGLPEDDPAIAVYAGAATSLVLTASGDVYTFGENHRGQLGHGDTTNRLVPTRVEALAGKRAIAATVAKSGHRSFVAVESDAGYEVYGSGDGRDGLLGLVNPSEGNRLSPVPIGAFNGKRIVSLSSGDYFLLALARSDADTTPPAPVSLVPDGTNAYVDVTFDEGVYGNPNGGSGLWAGDFKVEFSANGGGATGACVTAVRLPDGETPEEAGMPVGGETTLRLFLAIDGESTGVEEVKIFPAHRLAIFDAAGTPMEAETELGSFVLTDLTAPSIVDAARSSDTEIVVTFSEDVVGLDEADPADFLVVETGSDGSVEYEVTNVARGADDRHAVLTVSSMAASGKEGVTLLYTPGVGATIEDPSGHALAATEPEGVEIDPWDTAAPGISSVTRVDDVTLSVTFTEAVEPFDRADDGGFAVNETGDAAIAYAVTAAKSTNGGLGATLTVADLGPSAKEGVTVTYTASEDAGGGTGGGNGLIRDIAGNPMETTTTGVTIDPWDTEAPTIVSGTAGPGNAYVDVTFSEGVYGGEDGSGAVTADDFAVTLASNGGNATTSQIASVRKADGATPDEASPLSGGESTVRLFLTTDRPASGTEMLSVSPASASAIFDRAGHALGASQSTGQLALADALPPEIVSVDRSGDTMLIVTLSEDATGLTQANDGGFLVEETGSGGEIAYPVIATARGMNDRQLLLTVSTGFGKSAKEGLTVRYAAEGNGKIADPAGNPLASTGADGIGVDPWDTEAPTIPYGPYPARDLTGRYYIEVNLSEGVFAADDGTGGLTADDFELVFERTDEGSAEAVEITGVEVLDTDTWLPAGVPTGGESSFLIYFKVTGAANGFETLYVKPKDGQSIFDLAGNAMLDEQSGEQVPLFNMTEPPEIVEAVLQDATTIVVTMSEDVLIWDELGENIRFTVEESGSDGGKTYAVTAVNQLTPEDAQHLALTVEDMSASAKEGVIVKYAAGDTLSITDWDYNEIRTTTGLAIDPWDTEAPAIESSAWHSAAAYVDITFSEGVYGSEEGTGALTADDFAVVFAANDGSAESASVSAVRAADGETPDTASALVGGETTVRVFLSVEGTPSGVETMKVTPANGASIFDLAGNSVDAAQSTPEKTLPDLSAPAMLSAVRNSDTQVTVELSEEAAGFTAVAHDGGFAVKETGSGRTYAVTAAAPGVDARHIVLTVGSMSVSAKEGVTVTYTAGGNGTIKDAADNPMETTSKGVTIDPWDTEAPTIETSEWDSAAAYVDITFSEGVYSGEDGTGALTADDFAVVFAANGGGATGASVSTVRAADGETADTASLLTGGETTVRVFLSVEGTPSGVETMKVTPADGASIFDLAGNSVAAAQSTPAKTLPDLTAPTIASSQWHSGAAYVDITFSEAVYGNEDGTGGLTADDFAVVFAANGGGAEDVSVSAVRAADGETAGTASALVGGETTVRVFLNVEGTPSGVETVKVTPADGASIFDLAGNSVDVAQSTTEKTLPDLIEPTIETSEWDSAAAYVDITFSEGVYGGEDGTGALTADDFAVVFAANGGGATGASVSAVRAADGETPDTASALVGGETTVRVFPRVEGTPSGVETVKVVVVGSSVFDLAGNAAPEDLETPEKTLPDLTPPTIETSEWHSAAAYVDITFNEGVYGSEDGTGGLTASDFAVVFAANDGGAESASVSAVRAADGETPDTASALVGGETTVRVFLSVEGTSSGVETVKVTPANGASIFDLAGNSVDAEQSTPAKTLPDLTAPTMLSAVRNSDTQVAVELSEEAAGFTAVAHDGGFAVKETGSGRTYAVTAAPGIDARHVVLTVESMSVSAKEGVTVTYTAGGNGTIADAAGNPMETTSKGVTIDPWDTEAPTIETSEWDSATAYVDITFSEGVYSSDDGTGALTADNFAVVFAANGGGAEGASVSAVRAADGETADTASLLTGGETTVRVFLNVEGTPSGVETVKVTPKNSASIFDLAGNSVDAAQSTPAKTLPDRRPPDDTGGVSSDEPAAEPVSDNIPIIVNGVVQEGMASSVVDVVDDRRVTSVKLDEQKLNERLAVEEDAPTVTVAIQNGSDAVKVELNGRMVQSLEMRGATLEVEVESAAYQIPAGQIDIVGAARQLGAETALEDIFVFIDIVNVPADELPEQADTGIAFVAPVVEFRITAVYGDRAVEIDGFTAYVERSIGIPEGEDRSRITTGVRIGPDGELMHVPTRVVERNGSYVAIISSLTNSAYSVIYNERTFADLAGHWARASVENMAGRLIVKGSPSGLFEPERAVTRAEFAAMTVRALGLDDAAANGPLARDVRADDWFAGAVASAERYGLVQGEPGGTFHPNDTITRQEAMVIVARAAALAGLAAPADPQAALAPFADASDVAAWARDGAALTAANGIVHGSGGWLAPLRELTRAEAAVILQRLLQTANLIDS